MGALWFRWSPVTDVASSLVGQGASQDMGCGRGSADGERRCGTASWKLRKCLKWWTKWWIYGNIFRKSSIQSDYVRRSLNLYGSFQPRGFTWIYFKLIKVVECDPQIRRSFHQLEGDNGDHNLSRFGCRQHWAMPKWFVNELCDPW